MTVTRSLDISQKPPILSIVGQLETHRYIDVISSLESQRYAIKGVTVVQESY
jgi:hypothetical protein